MDKCLSEMKCKRFCSEKLPLWKISKMTWLVTWKTSEKKTSHLSISSWLPKLLNNHSDRRHRIRHSQGLWRSLKADVCSRANNWTRTMYCTKLLHCTYTKMWTLSCRGISKHHGIFLERKPPGPKKTTRPCIKVGCLRPAVTFCLLFAPLPQTHVRFDSAFMSPVPQVEELKKIDGRGWPSHLRPAPPPPAMNPLSNRRLSRVVARRHHSGPWFLWFRWYSCRCSRWNWSPISWSFWPIQASTLRATRCCRGRCSIPFWSSCRLASWSPTSSKCAGKCNRKPALP